MDLLFDLPLLFEAIVSCQRSLSRMLSELAALKGPPEVYSLFAPGRLVLVHFHAEDKASFVHFGVLIGGEDSSTAIVDSSEKPSSSLLQNLRQDLAPKLEQPGSADIVASKFVWIRLLSPRRGGSEGEDLGCESRLEKVPLSAVVAFFNSRLRVQNRIKDFQGTASRKELLPLSNSRRDDDFSFGKSKAGPRKGSNEILCSPEEELKSIDRDLLSFASSTLAVTPDPFLDLPAEAKVRDFEFREIYSEWLLSAREMSSCAELACLVCSSLRLRPILVNFRTVLPKRTG